MGVRLLHPITSRGFSGLIRSLKSEGEFRLNEVFEVKGPEWLNPPLPLLHSPVINTKWDKKIPSSLNTCESCFISPKHFHHILSKNYTPCLFILWTTLTPLEAFRGTWRKGKRLILFFSKSLRKLGEGWGWKYFFGGNSTLSQSTNKLLLYIPNT